MLLSYSMRGSSNPIDGKLLVETEGRRTVQHQPPDLMDGGQRNGERGFCNLS